MQVWKYFNELRFGLNEGGVYRERTGLRIILTFSEQFGIQTHTNHQVALTAQHAEKHEFSTTCPL